MNQQQSTSRKRVLSAAVALLFALAAFSAAFYIFDGSALLEDLVGRITGVEEPSTVPTSQVTSGSAVPTGTAVLPEPTMTQEFALRLWQEQVDSQATIGRLVEGDITRIDVESITTTTVDAQLGIRAFFADGSAASGVLGMRSFGDHWYFAYLSGTRSAEDTGLANTVRAGTGEPPEGALPVTSTVDFKMLNVILAQQKASSSILEEYPSGRVRSIDIGEPRRGLGTVTVPLTMREDHETATADLILIGQDIGGTTRWFITRFAKTGSTPIK